MTYQMLKSMRKTVPSLSPSASSGKKKYDMMMDQKVAEELSGGETDWNPGLLYRQLKGNPLPEGRQNFPKVPEPFCR